MGKFTENNGQLIATSRLWLNIIVYQRGKISTTFLKKQKRQWYIENDVKLKLDYFVNWVKNGGIAGCTGWFQTGGNWPGVCAAEEAGIVWMPFVCWITGGGNGPPW